MHINTNNSTTRASYNKNIFKKKQIYIDILESGSVTPNFVQRGLEVDHPPPLVSLAWVG
jgi:hypothetical protein